MKKWIVKMVCGMLVSLAFILISPKQSLAQFGMGNTLAPLTGNDYPIIFTNDAKGGHHQVATIADRNKITTLRRQPGMLCTVMDDGAGNARTYQLICPDTKADRDNNANWVLFSGSGGGTGSGNPGKSAFEIWLELPGNSQKTKDDFFLSIRGEIGPEGKSAFSIWEAIVENKGKTENEFLTALKGAEGKSAFEIWKLIVGNENSSVNDYLNALKGENGADGKSAFDLWKELPANKDKTLVDYQTALKGEAGAKGDAGENGADGKSAFDLWKELPANKDKTLADYQTALKGEAGAKGDAGENGADGKSVLEIWKSIPENSGKPDSEFWLSMRGMDGKSAFDIWKEQSENANKSEYDFQLYMKGKAILNGIIDPESSIGTLGEFYINTNTQTLFGPKLDAVSWPTGVSLKGIDGISLDFKGSYSSLEEYKSSDGNKEALNKAYYNTTDKKSYIYNGTEWKIFAQDGTGTGGSVNFNGNRPITGLPTVGMNPGTDDLGKWIENAFYLSTKPTLSITPNPALGIREVSSAGTSSVALAWSVTRVAGTAELKTITLDGTSVFSSSPAENASVSGEVSGTITNNTAKTFTLTATTVDGKTASASTSVEFQYRRYYGFVDGGEDGVAFIPSNAQILALSGKSFGTTAAFSANVKPTGSQKLVIAYPASWGGTKIIVGVNDSTGAFTKTQQSVTNASGGVANYVVFVQKDNTAAGYDVAVQ